MRRSSIRHIPAFALAALFILGLSCYVPLYNETAALSARFGKGLESIARFGPWEIGWDTFDSAYFVPSRADKPSFGYWIEEKGDGYLNVGYAGRSGASFNQGGFTNEIRDGYAFMPVTESEATFLTSTHTPPDGFVLISGFSSNMLKTAYFLDQYGSRLQSSFYLPSYSYSYMVGAGWYPSDAAPDGLDHIAFLFYDNGPVLQGGDLTLSDMDFAQLNSPSGPSPLSGLAGLTYKAGAFFAKAATTANPSFYILSGQLSSGELKTFRYDGSLITTPTELAGITHRVSAVLSDGSLLCSQAGETWLYDLSGNLKAHLLTGNWRFVWERKVGGTQYAYFSRSLAISESGTRSLVVDVARVPLADLASLEY